MLPTFSSSRCLIFSSLASALWLLAGCHRDAPPAAAKAEKAGPANSTHPSEAADVELALNWFPEAEHGGYFAALVHGYYKEAGLNVKIVPGSQVSTVLQRVASGQVAFGIENADRVLLGRAQEADVVAVMAPLQKSPRAIMVHAQSGIHRIEDLANVTLAVNSGATWVQYLKKRVLFQNVRFVPYAGNVTQFLLNENYAQQAYVFSEPFLARQHGAEATSLLVAETGFNPYTSVLLTSGQQIRTRPEVVRKFVAAAVRGWLTYLERPEETNRYIHQINPQMGLEILAYGVEALRPLCHDTAAGQPLGQMTAQRWQTLASQLVTAGALTAGAVDPLRAFTTEFLPAIKEPPTSAHH